MSIRRIAAFLGLVCLLLPPTASSQEAATQTYTYGVEIHDVLCGYSELGVSRIEEEGIPRTLLEQRLVVMLSALGFELTRTIDLTYRIDPATGRFTRFDLHLQQGDVEMSSEIVVDGDTARCTSLTSPQATVVDLPAGVLLQNPLFWPIIRRDFVDDGYEERVYPVLNVTDATVHDVSFTKIGAETLELAGRPFDSVIVDQLDLATGVKTTLWIHVLDGMVLKVVQPSVGSVSYLADPSVKRMIELANVDENIATKTNVAISDVRNLSYMRVKARIEPTGLWLSAEDLSVPGQAFQGTVENNVIEGIFEIEHPRYDGTNAPPFPTAFAQDETLATFLEPQDLLESDDPVLREVARDLTAGSENAWEAATRLSRWVADNIDYEIPGGMSARRTYDLRAGECGAHSLLLAAFCRAVEIPSRVVWGCTYTPIFGGSFGQHGWTEVYMGDAGWIPVDSTAYEADFVDSGHVRIGAFESLSTSLNAKSMEILDYRVRSRETEEHAAAAGEPYAPFVGGYVRTGGADRLDVSVMDDHLAITTDDQTVLPLEDPDAEGSWVCSFTEKLYATFGLDDEGSANQLTLHEVSRLRRRSEPEEIPEDVPEELRPLLGGYYVPTIRKELVVLWNDDGLAVRDPGDGAIVRLLPVDDGLWSSERTGNRVSFARNQDGTIRALVLDAAGTYTRTNP